MKIIFFSSLLISISGLFGCKKNYTCYCTKTTESPGYTYNNVTYSAETTSSLEYYNSKDKKENAQAECSFREYSITRTAPNAAQGQPDETETVSCELKADSGKN